MLYCKNRPRCRRGFRHLILCRTPVPCSRKWLFFPKPSADTASAMHIYDTGISLFGKIELIKYVCSSREPTDAEFGLNLCFSRPDRPASGALSLRWNTMAADYSCGLSACRPCLPHWLAGFFLGWFIFFSPPAAKCRLHMFIHAATGCFIRQYGHIGIKINEKLVKK